MSFVIVLGVAELLFFGLFYAVNRWVFNGVLDNNPLVEPLIAVGVVIGVLTILLVERTKSSIQ